MKRITTLPEIDFSIMGTTVYVFDNAVLISITKRTNSTYSIQVTNANYTKPEFDGKSYGSDIASLDWIISNLEYWVDNSKTKSHS